MFSTSDSDIKDDIPTAGGISIKTRRTTAAAAALVLLAAAAFTVSRAATHKASDPGPDVAHGTSLQAADAPDREARIQTVRAWPYVRFDVIQRALPQGLVGLSLSIDRGRVFAAGGYNGLQSVRGVRQLFPQRRLLARLTVPTHDAASAWIGSNLYVFGGGQAASTDRIVRIRPSQAAVVDRLQTPLSDAGMVPYANGGLLIGGHNGGAFSLEGLLYTARGPALHAKRLFRLPVGLRYAAVAPLGNRLWIAGGRTANGMSRTIYYYGPGLTQAEAVGRLPAAIDKAAAWAVPGFVLIAGGQTLQGAPQKDIYAFNVDTKKVRVVGTLPTPLTDMGYASSGRGTYLAGGATAANLSKMSRDLIVVYTTWFR